MSCPHTAVALECFFRHQNEFAGDVLSLLCGVRQRNPRHLKWLDLNDIRTLEASVPLHPRASKSVIRSIRG